MQSSRSLQPRWGRGFTALSSSYPRKVVAFGQSWICESWTGLCTSSRSRCWRTGAWSNAFSPRIGLQRSTWRTLTLAFRSFRDTDRHGRQYRVLPFGLSLSPRVFTKVVEGALTPLREVGVRILNYLDDWLILAQSREQLGDHRDLVLRHLSQLGLRVNWEKSKLSPVQRISFLGVELDSVSMMARLTEERAQAALNCLSSFRGRNVVPLKQFQRLLGHMASAAAVTPLGLLHMRPLQHWLHSRVPKWAWRHGTLRVGISQQCRRSLSPWTDLAFLRAGVPLEQVSRHTVVTTDASSTGWGATCNGQAASGLWTGPRLLWHINCLELWAVHLALRQFRPLLLGKHVLVRTDNTAAASYINRLGDTRSHRMSQLARHLLLWSHTQFKSLRAIHIPGQLNRAADALSRQLTFPGEWRLHPETIRLIWSRFGEAQADLFASPSPPTASCTSPWPRAPSAQTHWHIAGLGPYASMRFPQWVYSHRHCTSSGRTRSRSCWLRPIGPPGPGFPNSFPSRQHLPGAFLWGRTLVPSWDLSIVLAGLQRGPFEPLDSVELKFLSLKTVLLTALTSIKRVGDPRRFR